MKEIAIQASTRKSVGKGLYALRRAGKIPAVVYGPGIDSLAVELEAKEGTKILNGISGSTLLHLKVDGKDISVLVRDLQRDSIRLNILHVDFYAVPTDRVIRVHVPLVFSGVSPAVRDFGGILVHVITGLDVECLPKDLVNEIHVDISTMEKIGDSIAVKDIALSAGIHVLMDQNESVAMVTIQKEEEEPAPVATAAVPTEVEVIEKGKKLEEGEEEAEKETKETKK